MQPFRAPRKRAQKKGTVLQDNASETRSDNASPSRRSPRRKGKAETEVHVVPYIKCIKMMSERESTEMAQHGKVLRCVRIVNILSYFMHTIYRTNVIPL
jgi:hypothetical protein